MSGPAINWGMQKRFTGLDNTSEPHLLGETEAAETTNLFPYRNRLQTRFGLQGCFVTKLGAGIPTGIEFKRSDGTTVLLFCSGAKLYFTVLGTPPLTYTEVLIGGLTSFALVSDNVRFHREGKFVYVIDGVVTPYRINIAAAGTYTAEVVSGLTAPAVPTGVSLTNTTLDAMSDPTKWSSYPVLTWPSGTVGTSTAQPETFINTANTQFAGGTSSPSPWPTGWTDGGDTPGYQAAAALIGGQEIYADRGAGPSWADWAYPSPSYASGTNTISRARVWAASTGAHSTVSGQFLLQMFPCAASVSSQTVINFTDIVIVAGAATSTITSAANPFQTSMIGKVVTIFSGTNFTKGNYTITAVNAGTHVATVNGNIGTTASTAGVGTLSLDSGGTAAADGNYTILNPASAIPGAYQTSDTFTGSASNQTFSNVFSFSQLTTDPDSVLFRILGPGSSPEVGINSPSMRVVDVRLIAEASSAGTLHLKANNPISVGANCLGGVWLRRDYTTAVQTYTDIVLLSDGSTSTMSSVAHPFAAADVGRVIVITAGTNWTAGTYTITAVNVSTHVATVTGDMGTTAGSGAGSGYTYEPEDFSHDAIIAVGYSSPTATGQIPFRFGFQKAGTAISTIEWSESGTYTEDGKQFYCNISNLDPLVLAQTSYFYIQIIDDLPDTINPADLCTIGPLTLSGNLSVDASDYNYVTVESRDTTRNTDGSATTVTNDGTVLSNPSGPTVPNLTPTVILAQSTMIIADWTNATANMVYVYRFGGVFPGSGETVFTSYRLIAKCPRWAGGTYTATGWTWDATASTWTSTDTYRTWKPSTRVFTDNTPDLAIIEAEFLIRGREVAPTALTSLAGWQNRLWGSKQSTVYGSWLLAPDQAAGLYWSESVDLDDPVGIVKGAKIPVAANDNDTVQQLVSLGQYLVVLKQRSLWLITGQDPVSGFQLTPYLRDAAVGTIAPRSAGIYGKRLLFLNEDGLIEYDGDETTSILTGDIERGVSPQQDGNAPLNRAALAKAALWVHGRQIYLFMPDEDDTSNTVAWVFNAREPGWTKFEGVAVSGGVSLGSDAITDTMYLFGLDGQLYRYYGASDIPTLTAITGASSASPIVITSTTHGLVTGDKVNVTGVGGNTAANGDWTVTRLTANTVSLDGSTWVSGAYTTGGAIGKRNAISWSFQSRGFGQDTDGPDFFMENLPLFSYAQLTTNESTSVTIETSAVGCTPTSSYTDTVNGSKQLKKRVHSGVRGSAVQIKLSGSSREQVKISAVGAEIGEGSDRATA